MWTTLQNCLDLRHEWLRAFIVLVTKIYLKNLDLFSMSHQCLHRDLILAYPIRHQMMGLSQSDFFSIPFRNELRGLSSKFLQKSANCQRRRNALSIRAVSFWNRLSAEVRKATILSVIKLNLDLLWPTVFDNLFQYSSIYSDRLYVLTICDC